MAGASGSNQLWTVPEVAQRLQVTEETVRRWLRGGELAGVRLSRKAGWRIRERDIEAFLQAHGTGPTQKNEPIP